MDKFSNMLVSLNDWVTSNYLVVMLIGCGLYFTWKTRFMQVRLFRHMIVQVFSSRNTDGDGISGFQAFAIGIASRVGTGNIAGVAIAVTLGGAGAVFWMWIVAFLGMATAFVEATLAQMFKVRWHDGTFRGGPAYYIQKGLGSRKWGCVFALFLIFSFGISYEMVQANTIADTLKDQYQIDPKYTAIGLLLITMPIVFGGLKRVARVSEIVAPLMAIVYITLAFVIVLMNADQILPTFRMIIESAFGLRETLGGAAGSLTAAMINGVRRGLFSNEAGEGSAPNAASTAQVTHPAKQGMIQSIGVFVDTILVCSATAFIIFNAAPGALDQFWAAESPSGAAMTITAVQSSLGQWTGSLMVILICVFAASSIIGNFAYAEVNMDFLTQGKRWGNPLLKVIVLTAVVVGALAELEVVWAFADLTMSGMALINIVAIALLGKWAFAALKDYMNNTERPFVAADSPYMPGELPTEVWVHRESAYA